MARPILIIEDDADIAEALRYSLEKVKFQTRVACNGAEGLSASLDKENPPALILLDLLLPGMNGIEVCRRLRREPSTESTPIVMLTAKGSEADFARAWAAGVDDYITKPFSIPQCDRAHRCAPGSESVPCRSRTIDRRIEDQFMRAPMKGTTALGCDCRPG